MFLSNNEEIPQTETLNLHPIIHVSDCLKGYQKQLAQNEVSSLNELQEVQLAFQEILEENAALKEKLDSFHEFFGAVGNASDQFDGVKENITASVNDAQQRIGCLKESSKEVQEHFVEIQSTFADFEASVQKIKECMNQIISIANQTNMLALDASEQKLPDVTASFDLTEHQFETVLSHIERANDLGATKSSMFEDMDNMLSQIAPIARELEQETILLDKQK